MSLTSMLRGKTEKDIRFQNILRNLINPRPIFTTHSGKKPFSSEYEELAPYTLSNRYYAGLVGTSFDYLARFIIAKELDNKELKKECYNNLIAERGLSYLEKVTTKKEFNILNNKYKKGIKKVNRVVHNKKIDFEEVLKFSGYLASLEVIVRSGIPPTDIESSLIEDTNIEIVNDLRNLSNVFINTFIDSKLINKNSKVIFNPNFGIASSACGGADADIFIDGILYDFKCTKSKGYKWQECAQIIAYFLLNVIEIKSGGNGITMDRDEYGIRKLAFYKGRYGEIEYLDIRSIDKDKIEHTIQELRKLFGLRFLQKTV